MIQPLTDQQLTDYFSKRREYFDWDRKVHKNGEQKPNPKEIEASLRSPETKPASAAPTKT